MTRRPPAIPVSGRTAQVFRIRQREALNIRRTPTGDVGLLYSGEGIEAVWVSKDAEKIDPRWFQYPRIDILAVLQGRLKVEFKGRGRRTQILGPGDVLLLPPGTACRAYRWPRSAARPTVFLAVYRKSRIPTR
jgi:mannose-6-phosphate isomerase-like protein (cupin superfamily)